VGEKDIGHDKAGDASERMLSKKSSHQIFDSGTKSGDRAFYMYTPPRATYMNSVDRLASRVIDANLAAQRALAAEARATQL
jgi:hypothetical protein